MSSCLPTDSPMRIYISSVINILFAILYYRSVDRRTDGVVESADVPFRDSAALLLKELRWKSNQADNHEN
jgi:hypothetical protein